MLIRRKSSSVAGIERSDPAVATPFFEPYPALFEFLTVDMWDEKVKRLKGTINIFYQDGRWKCWLNDKDGKRSACVTASSPEDLLLCAEAGLLGDDLDWRAERPSGAARGGR